MNHFVIKPMQSEDEIDGKAYVHFQACHEAYSDLMDPSYLQALTLEKCKNITQRRTDNVLIAKDGEQVIGFAIYDACQDLPGYGELIALYVLEACYGKKVGYGLMHAALEQLSGYDKIVIWVLKGNERAIRFYERFGCRFDGTEQAITLGTPNTKLRMIFDREVSHEHANPRLF